VWSHGAKEINVSVYLNSVGIPLTIEEIRRFHKRAPSVRLFRGF
jgi:hypothetical protein